MIQTPPFYGLRAFLRGMPLALSLPFVSLACASEALESDAGSGAGTTSAAGGGSGAPGAPRGGGNGCSAALRQGIALVDQVTPASVTVLQRTGAELLLYVDASTGGIGGQDVHPWVYISLRSGQRVNLTDIEALSSSAWDLALKRAVLRTNSGDSGSGAGGAVRVTQSWSTLTRASADAIPFEVEGWFDSDCVLRTDAAGAVLTTFGDWSLYDEATHRLTPSPSAYLVRGGDGALYKLAILDYYSKPNGTTGASDGGHYKLRVAALE